MHKSELGLENETHQILWDFKIQADDQIQARRPDLVLINLKKRTYHLVDLTAVKMKEREKIEKYLDLAREQKSSKI